MSNIIVEGFGAYGTGETGVGVGNATVQQAMLSGIWGEATNPGSGTWGIGTLPWDLANEDLYLFQTQASPGAGAGGVLGWRRVLPAALDVSMWSFFYALNSLPLQPNVGSAIEWRDGSNNPICALVATTTGALSLQIGNGNVVGITAGPVLTVENAVHMEMKLDTDAGTFELYVSGKEVINLSGLAFINPGPVAQFTFISIRSDNSSGNHYGSHLIVRDTGGTTNNTFPIGERKVATLFPNSDDPAHQGWSAHPVHRFGNGVLDLTVKDLSSLTQFICAVAAPGDTHTDFGAGDFTVEGQFRWQSLPQNADKSVLWGKWDEMNNQRSYQFYLGGPTLESGLLVFRTSTDGQNGTVVEKLKWAFTPVPGTWYEIAMVRSGGELLLFINGVQQGLPEPDADTYFVGTEICVLGGQSVVVAGNTGIIAGTNFVGWQDEFRISKGLARYTANYAPHTTAFPRNSGDPNWGSVVWLSSWDEAVVADDGPLGLALVSFNGARAITPDDGDFFFELLNKNAYPFDDSFIQAELIAATGLLTYSANPVANETVHIGTTNGVTAAVYKFVAALAAPFDVLIGVNLAASMNNLIAAVLGGAGIGVVYGTGTTANASVTAQLEPTNQVLFTASTAGAAGNALPSTTTGAHGTFSAATLLGGLDIPPYSQYGLQRMPSNTSVVDSVTIATRAWKTDAGTAETQTSFVGPAGGVLHGTIETTTTTPTVTFDTFETDPDTAGPLSPTSVLLAKVRIDRVA